MNNYAQNWIRLGSLGQPGSAIGKRWRRHRSDDVPDSAKRADSSQCVSTVIEGPAARRQFAGRPQMYSEPIVPIQRVNTMQKNTVDHRDRSGMQPGELDKGNHTITKHDEFPIQDGAIDGSTDQPKGRQEYSPATAIGE